MIGLSLLLLAAAPAPCGSFEEVADRVWEFRARTMPFSVDDVPRLERPPGLVRSWSKASVQGQREELAALTTCLAQATATESSWPVARRVDVRLIRSALARVRWELDVNRRRQRDPGFYLDQALTPVLELLVEPPPVDGARARELTARLHNVPALLKSAEENLAGGVQLFAQLALSRLVDIRETLGRVETAVLPLLPKDAVRNDFSAAIRTAADALETYRAWLTQHAPSMRGSASVGREAYLFFLQQVALLPYTPEQMLAMAEQEWARSAAAEALEVQRNAGLPPLAYIPSLELQTARYQKDEVAIRKFLEERGILSVPTELHHFTVQRIPTYVDALGEFGEQDWFTGPSTLNQDGVRWLYPPSPKLGYFGSATARDPAPSHHARGCPRTLFPADAVLEKPGPDPAPLLRLWPQRGTWFLRRGDDDAGGTL